MHRSLSTAGAVLTPALALMTALLPPARTYADGAPVVTAVWRQQTVKFHYMGHTSRYSCEGLHQKVRALLVNLGVRRNPQITEVGCDSLPALVVVFAAPSPLDNAAPSNGAGAAAVFDARFEGFTITNDAFRNFDVADCELVEEFARQILPRLATRGVEQRISCAPDQLRGSNFVVRGQVLRPARDATPLNP